MAKIILPASSVAAPTPLHLFLCRPLEVLSLIFDLGFRHCEIMEGGWNWGDREDFKQCRPGPRSGGGRAATCWDPGNARSWWVYQHVVQNERGQSLEAGSWRALNAKVSGLHLVFRSAVLQVQPFRPVVAAAPRTLLEMLNIRSQLRAAESETLGRGLLSV